ncbi:uncharacterized protein [Gossypium hirsutum]|uniref:Uncharacterized protein isoform X1 n=1 Tax=Gossypium hirsutum TaxID=3635 RepID=A0ABM3B7U2_GOSHI|nr:uncharacterized protein LOC121224267 isoform X1 [Gossypium hirsutum]
MIQAHVALHGPVISWDNFQMSCKGHQLRPYLESLIFISLILYQNVTHSTDIWKRVQHLCFLLVSFGRSRFFVNKVVDLSICEVSICFVVSSLFCSLFASVAAQLKDFRVCKCFRYHVASKSMQMLLEKR